MKTLEKFEEVKLSSSIKIMGGTDTVLDGTYDDWIDDGGNFNWYEGGAHYQTCPTGPNSFGDCY